jgi:peptidoglycan-associated lipoprotein
LDLKTRFFTGALLAASLIALAGCKHKVQTPVATAPPLAPPAPTANLTASPAAITAGEQVTLSWNTTNATTASIEGLGEVAASGTRNVAPSVSTTYHLVAKGNGGSADAYGRVTVTQPPVAAAQAPTLTEEQLFKAGVKDVFFDYDKSNLRNSDESVLSQDAAFLKNHPEMKVIIGGYCDERGSDEFNLALGQNRADSAQKTLIANGIDANRIRVISYGKEKPFCSEATESCWQENRRAGFSLDR